MGNFRTRNFEILAPNRAAAPGRTPTSFRKPPSFLDMAEAVEVHSLLASKDTMNVPAT